VREAWPQRQILLHCAACGHQTSVTARTIFQDTHKPLALWLRAMWYVTSQKNGASALGMKRVLGLGSYQTAWAWLHKLRRAMVRPERDRLSGWCERSSPAFAFRLMARAAEERFGRRVYRRITKEGRPDPGAARSGIGLP
jgi:hypothetical protein